jgi:hypothetical protein
MREDLIPRLRSIAAAEPVPAGDLVAVRRRGRRLRARRIAAATLAAMLLGGAVAVPISTLGRLDDGRREPAADAPTPTIGFAPAQGWHVLTGGDPSSAGGAQAWAATVPFADGEAPGNDGVATIGWPDRTIDRLPTDGVVIVAGYPLVTRNPVAPVRAFPARALPLTIRRPPGTAFEGNRPGTSQTSVGATVNGRYVSVRFTFGSEDPSAATIRAAEEELARLLVAPPPTVTDELDDFGIGMDVPANWSRLLFSWDATATLQAGTVRLDDPYAFERARDELGPDDVVVLIAETGAVSATYEPVELPISVAPADACRCEVLDDGRLPDPDHTLLYRAFAVGDRRFELAVEFGTGAPTDDQLADVNAVLATLRIEAGSAAPIPQVEGPPLPDGPTVVAGDRTATFSYDGGALRATLPPGWTGVAAPAARASEPRILAAFGTWGLPAGGGCAPDAALAALPSDAALVWIAEHLAPENRGDFIGWPSAFRLPDQAPPARWACGSAAPSVRELYQLNGRYVEVHVAFGPTAPASLRDDVETLLSGVDAVRSDAG